MIGVIADDITGANDIGIMFVNRGYRTIVLPLAHASDSSLLEAYAREVDVVVVDTDCRLLDAATAYARSREAVHILRHHGGHQFFVKVCSAFRGNVGAVFDAVLDEIGVPFAPVVLGFPKNGRTTLHSVHHVHGVKLEESEFRNDPIHPMRESNLCTILRRQTRRRVQGLWHETLDACAAQGAGGSAALALEIDRAQATTDYLIFDVRHQADLEFISQALYDRPVICGSSAIAETWPLRAHTPNSLPAAAQAIRSSRGVLLVAGSLMPQTLQQVAAVREAGHACVEIDTVDLVQDPSRWRRHITPLLEDVVARLHRDENVLMYASHDAERVQQTLVAGQHVGLSMVQTRKRVSGTLATLAQEVVAASGVRRVIVGGGDTSGAVCSALGVRGVEVLRQIAPGLPLSVSLGDSPFALILKSGSFGSRSFFLDAISAARAL
ncbi:MAG: hypothetical protein K6T83_02740 [Alicyclobacillus sp.]|nr:hypothetical protein [Alicyclobacillus sp.]